jgi:RNA polymerase sigma factor (sigma-70 family)
MGDALLTRPSLIARLGDPADRAAWRQFVELYGGLVYGFARRRGLQDADAADLTQEVFLAVARAAGRWRFDRGRGSFRGWLHGITRHKIGKWLERRRRQPPGSGDTDARLRLAEEPAPGPDAGADWEQEFRRRLFRLAAEQVRGGFAPATWEAFWLTAVEGRSGAAAAAALGLSVGAVYVARSRVLARLTERIRAMRAEWSDG